jgi:hypothetical protein
MEDVVAAVVVPSEYFHVRAQRLAKAPRRWVVGLAVLAYVLSGAVGIWKIYSVVREGAEEGEGSSEGHGERVDPATVTAFLDEGSERECMRLAPVTTSNSFAYRPPGNDSLRSLDVSVDVSTIFWSEEACLDFLHEHDPCAAASAWSPALFKDYLSVSWALTNVTGNQGVVIVDEAAKSFRREGVLPAQSLGFSVSETRVLDDDPPVTPADGPMLLRACAALYPEVCRAFAVTDGGAYEPPYLCTGGEGEGEGGHGEGEASGWAGVGEHLEALMEALEETMGASQTLFMFLTTVLAWAMQSVPLVVFGTGGPTQRRSAKPHTAPPRDGSDDLIEPLLRQEGGEGHEDEEKTGEEIVYTPEEEESGGEEEGGAEEVKVEDEIEEEKDDAMEEEEEEEGEEAEIPARQLEGVI